MVKFSLAAMAAAFTCAALAACGDSIPVAAVQEGDASATKVEEAPPPCLNAVTCEAWGTKLQGPCHAATVCTKTVSEGGLITGTCSWSSDGKVAGSETKCDDGNACTDKDVCAGQIGTCKGVPKVCDDNSPCTDDACDIKTGCVSVLLQVGCTDGDACTTGDKCEGKACKGNKIACDDNNPCTADSCDKAIGCVNKAVAIACDDGNKCTEDDKCVDGACSPGAPKACDDTKPCTEDQCDIKTGCKFQNKDGLACDDGLFATKDDACVAGACKGVPFYGCKANADCASLKSKCGVFSCQAGTCEYSNSSVPNDGNECTNDTCSEVEGVTYKPKAGVQCEDGTACTVDDACDNKGACKGTPKVCDDGDKCTVDLCDSKSGCAFKAMNPIVDCADSNGYTVDSCNKTMGCVHTAVYYDFKASQPVDYDDQYTPVVGVSYTAKVNGTWVKVTLPQAAVVSVFAEMLCPAYATATAQPTTFTAYSKAKVGVATLVIGGKYVSVKSSLGKEFKTEAVGDVLMSTDGGEIPQEYLSAELAADCQKMMAGN